ncbi:SpoIVB peptidase S55 domain-containing protein [uncultured Megamonas sp.]|uniref:SpoIVB peptidase S55 domain-containing protein n=1 Tax=uncultured Megamonas sp. TaxID=286140 RepID=UPI00266E98B1|nr:SpoIVB peptidase S55 domain-containing protein [uncultured Megamonas sp.]
MIKYLVTICLMLLLYTNSALAMPPIMKTSELRPGMQGYAETVVQGAQKVSFNVEIIGVVNNGKGSPKQILARAYGPIIDDTNGVIHGMSGSPVYVDGKLIGAVARAVGQDVLPYKFYITPIEEMLDIWNLPDPLTVINKSNIKIVDIPSLEEYEKNQDDFDKNIDKEVEKYKSKHLATPEGKEAVKGKAQKRLEEILSGIDIETEEDKNSIDDEDIVQTDKIIKDLEDKSKTTIDADKLEEHISLTSFILKSLQKEYKSQASDLSTTKMMPIYVSGFNDNALNFLAENLKYKNMTPYATGEFISSPIGNSGSDIKENATLSAGDPVGVVLAYGDFSAGGTGTVTAVDGNKILGFGHAMTYKGNVNYFMTEADVIGSAGGILNGVKVSSFGKIIGRINQDRFNGVAGILNEYPASIPVRVKVTDRNLGQEKTFVSKVAYDEDILPTLASSIVYASMDRTADRASYGTSKIKFTIMTDEVPEGKFERENMYYDPKDVGQFTVGELTQALYFLCTNMEKPSNILDVKVDVDFTSSRKTASIVSAIPDKEEAKPGDLVNFSVTLKPYRRENVTVTIPYTIPKTQKEGQMFLEVKGGGFVQLAQVLQSGLAATPQDAANLSTVDRLNDLKNLNKNNEIVISPTIDTQSEVDQDKAIKEAIKLSEEIGKMSKKEREEFNKNRESKISTDYVVDNFIQTSIKIKK